PFPAWAFETIKFLYEQRGVIATGHEAMDTDTTDKMESETYILQHGHYQIEVMANLDKVPSKGALIVVTWPKVRKGLGFPARAFAILPCPLCAIWRQSALGCSNVVRSKQSAREPPQRGDISLPAPAQTQPGRLVDLGA